MMLMNLVSLFRGLMSLQGVPSRTAMMRLRTGFLRVEVEETGNVVKTICCRYSKGDGSVSKRLVFRREAA